MAPKRKLIEYIVNERGCYICVSHSTNHRYPHIHRDGKHQTVVKYLWEQVNGLVPEGLGLLHSCDDAMCINIEHVRSGTQVENNVECSVRGRKKCKLFKNDVLFIRANYIPCGQCLRLRELADMFGVCFQSISGIVNRKTWKSV